MRIAGLKDYFILFLSLFTYLWFLMDYTKIFAKLRVYLDVNSM